MPTTTRKHGTKVTVALTPQERIAAVQDVIQNGYAKIDGTTIDGFSAGAIMSVYNSLAKWPEKQLNFASKKAGVMAILAFKIINKYSK